jgi:UDP-N-acetylglucosamine--N-acetylmuramyl-(pentapeptide) pyrophosphoryl-undecaprenol N-acetylglucosamine transferase
MRQIDATVVPFVADVPAMLAGTDLAVCRAGGTTLAELAAAAVPAVLVPYPHAADDHQRQNAEVFAAAGGCVIVDPRDPEKVTGTFCLKGPKGATHKRCLSPFPVLDCRLTDAIGGLIADPARRNGMAQAIHRLARPDAARDVAATILRIAEPSRASVDMRAA